MHRGFDLALDLPAQRSVASDGNRQLNVRALTEAAHQSRSLFFPGIDQVKDASRSLFTIAIAMVGHLRKPIGDRKPEYSYLLFRNARIAQDVCRIFVGNQKIIADAAIP